MSKRRRFTADFKAKVALESLRGDRTIQEIAARHKVHPNQVSTWKRQAMDGLDAIFSNGAGRPVDTMDKAIALPTSPQAQQQQRDLLNKILAA